MDNAVLSSGWRHKFDNILQRTLNNAPFWPKWIALFKHLVSFLRDVNNLAIFAREYKRRGERALACIGARRFVCWLSEALPSSPSVGTHVLGKLGLNARASVL